MTDLRPFLTAMTAVNVAIPFLGARLLPWVFPDGSRVVAVMAFAAGLVSLNFWIARRFPRWRVWVWLITGLNLVALILFGSLAAATALPGVWLLLRTL